MALAIFSTRAKWRSSLSARGSVHETHLTEPTLLEMVQRREGISQNRLARASTWREISSMASKPATDSELLFSEVFGEERTRLPNTFLGDHDRFGLASWV